MNSEDFPPLMWRKGICSLYELLEDTLPVTSWMVGVQILHSSGVLCVDLLSYIQLIA